MKKTDFLSVQVQDQEVQKMLESAEINLSHGHTSEVLAEVGALILANDKANWGRGWKKQSASTKEQKEKLGQTEPEVRTGAYKRSLTEPGAEGQIHEIGTGAGGMHLKIGTDLWYAKFQQGTKHQPRRTALRMTPTVKREIQEFLREKLLP